LPEKIIKNIPITQKPHQMAVDDSEVNKAYSAYQTLLQMLCDRGYYTSEEMRNLNRETFAAKYHSGNDIIIIVPKPNSDDKIMVYIIEDNKNISNKVVENMAKKLKEHHIRDGIIMSNCALSPPAEKVNPNSAKFIFAYLFFGNLTKK
jgi:hypothetical protein